MSIKETTPAPAPVLAPAPSTSHLIQSNIAKVLSPKVPAAHDNSTQNPQSQQQKQDIKNVGVTVDAAQAKRLLPNLPCRDLLTEEIGSSTSESMEKIGSTSEQLRIPPVLENGKEMSEEIAGSTSEAGKIIRSTSDQLPPVLEDIRPLKQSSTNEMEKIGSTIEQLPPVLEDIRPLNQGQQFPPNADNYTKRLLPNLPCRDLLTGSRENYLKIGVPLYEASVKCDWKAAKAILDNKKELVRYSITENGETALHVAASAKGPKEFVKNLVDLMNPEDLAHENENFNTALYLAAAAGNLETVKIMVTKNKNLLTIPGAGGQMLPLYVAALFGHYDVVKYLFKMSNNLGVEEGWNPQNRGWLVEKCVENDMFDVALQIVERYPEVGRGNVIQSLAGKPEAFPETKSNIFGRTIKPVLTFIRSKVGNSEKENKALPLLRAVWNDIVKLPKKDIDKILRGPPDPIKQDKSASGRAVQAIQLQNLIFKHVDEMLAISKKALKGLSRSIKQYTNPVSGKEFDQALELQNLISAQLVRMHVDTQNIIKDTPDSLSSELEKLIFEHIVKLNENTWKIIKTIAKENQVQSLQKAIYKHTYDIDKETKRIINKDAYSSRVLFIAAEKGNTNFLVELIRLYPDLIWKVNDDNLTIFHIAVRYRHAGIYNLLYEIGAMKDMITPLKDPKDNNMLHLLGMSARDIREDVPGDAFLMQRELLWFEEVKKMIPPSYRERRNRDGLTPHELFTKEHHELVTEGEKWMKKIAAQCMVVAALIATMVFAAAFTVPGGYDQQNGIPIFHSKLSFQIFVVADAISLFLSTASVLYMFLSVFTSRYCERDFLVSVPKKLIVGLSYLFLSITSMMIAFCTGFFILYQKGLLWMPILISVFALIPFFLYIKVQFFLFVDIILTTFSSRHLFDPMRRVLYYENPKL